MTGCDKGCQSAILGFTQLLRTGCQYRQLKPIKFSVIDYIWESESFVGFRNFTLMAAYATRSAKITRQRLIRLADQTPHWLKVAINRRSQIVSQDQRVG